MENRDLLEAAIGDLVQPFKGVLALDESAPTIAKRFASVGVESTPANRRDYRQLLLSTAGLGDYISGVILFEETLAQRHADGRALPEFAIEQGIVAGVKVDLGKIPLAGALNEEITQGLDGLAERLARYRTLGARFAKWREVYSITDDTPSRLGIAANAQVLARYAAICQEQGFVPIVEPEVLIDGGHDIQRSAEVSEVVLRAVFAELYRHRVVLEYMLLKPSMVIPGKDHMPQASPEEVAEQTIRIFRRAVPAAVPSINFLSGGQTPQEASANLNALNCTGYQPWELSFSYGRALQEPALHAWQGDHANAAATQKALLDRARLNGAARRGEYTRVLELATA